MKATKAQVDRALKAPANVRLFLFHGPDESGSRALARRVPIAMGPDTERVDLTGGELKSDPARLADEAASISMFGSTRCILVSPAGDDCVEAVSALLGAQAAGNPVVIVAGALKATSKLLKLAVADPAALAFASYPPDARDLDRLVGELARERGLMVRPGVATRIAEAAGANRSIVEQELDKFAAYLDAAPGKAVPLDHDVVEAVGASLEGGDTTMLMDGVFDGDGGKVEGELARLRGEGGEGITLLRAALRRALLLARLRVQVEQGQSPANVAGAQGKALFWKEKDAVTRQIAAWPADRLARAVSRLLAAERDVKQSGLGPVAADVELLAIARQASRRG